MAMLATGATVLVDEMPLDPLVAGKLMGVIVETSLHLPNVFELHFSDFDRTAIELGGFLVGSPVQILVSGDDIPDPLVNGFVTALELEYDDAGKRTIVRGMDASARLMRGKNTKVFEEMLASEIVEMVLAERGIVLTEIIPSDVFYQYKLQADQTDWQFIQKLAVDTGYRAYMDSLGVFHFQPITPAETMPVPGTAMFSLPTQLVLGQSLRSLRAVVRDAEQVEGVEVSGWSPLEGGPVLGAGVPEAIGIMNEVQPEELATLGGGGVFRESWFPTDSEDEAEAKAEAIANQLAETYVELQGEAFGAPELQAGVAVSLTGAGLPFDGSYTLTSARHVLGFGDAYITHIHVSGWQDRTMLGLASGQTQVDDRVAASRVPGVVCARVVDTRDPEDQGRVQLLFPWLDPTAVSDWARVMQFGAGLGSGYLIVPEEGSEVLVAFEQGDPRRPYVIGGLYNAIDEPLPSPLLIDEATGLVNERRMMSRDGHQVSFYDGEEQNGILVQTGDEVQQLKLDALEQTITIMNVDGEITISGAVVSIIAEGDLSLEATGELSLSGANVTIESEGAIEITTEGDLSVTGGAVELTAEEMMAIEGPIVAING